MEKELMIPEFADHWEKEREEREEIRMTIEMAEKREITSILLLAFSFGMLVASAGCLAVISKGVLW